MIYWVRWLIRLLLIILIGLLERVMGLPIVLILLSSLYAGRLDKYWRWSLLLLVGLLTAALFMVPLYLAWLVVGGSYLWVKHARQLLPSGVTRLIVGSLVGSGVVASYDLGQIYLGQLVYGLIAVLICLVWLKRYRFYLR